MISIRAFAAFLLVGLALGQDDSIDGRPCGAKIAPCPRGYTCQIPLTPCNPHKCIGKCRPDPVEGRPCGNDDDPKCPEGYACMIPLILCPPGEEERCRGKCSKI